MNGDSARARAGGPALEKCYQFLVWLLPTLEKFPRSQRFLLGDRIECTALDVLEGLVEATYSAQSEPLLRRVNLALEKLRFLFRLARDFHYLVGRRLTLHPVKTSVQRCAVAGQFLGFVLLPGGRRRLPEENVRRFRNRLRGLRQRWRAGTVSDEEVNQRLQAWIAHARHADTWRLRHAIFCGGWFDPAQGLGRAL